MEEITIRPMTEADLDEVIALENASFPSPWSRDHFRNEIDSPFAFPLVAVCREGAPDGYICPVLVLDEGEILNVAVRPGLRGRGMGRLLVETVLHEFRQRGAAFVSLEVRPSNTVAVALYGSCGFVPRGRRKAYYENGEDAIIMVYDTTGRKEGSHAV
jgi:ribosomal-protein-alanine N-acetyltransferase